MHLIVDAFAISKLFCCCVLRLWGNKIGDAGAEALAGALVNSTTLVWLRYVCVQQ